MIFLCPLTKDFQHNYNKCECCEQAATCQVYKYEVEFQKKEGEDGKR